MTGRRRNLKADPNAMLVKELQRQVRLLEDDLRPTGLEDPRLHDEWEMATSAHRTAATFETWLGERVTQVAVAWVLSSVFVRFCEDNGLIEYPFITGPSRNEEDRAARAAELQEQFYLEHPEKANREWLEEAFAALSVSPVVAGLFDRRHNPMWSILPSNDAVKALLDFWRAMGEDGEIRYDFTDSKRDTRFLGNLYQDLSESARKKYALLQTPEFVERFILEYTLGEAIKNLGLEPEDDWGYLRLIDPACGSGHFLLGAFHRLYDEWQARTSLDPYECVAKALQSVHGVDKNPFAVAIARFRLLIAAMRKAEITTLSEKVDFPLCVAVGDSLIHGRDALGDQGEFDLGDFPRDHTYRTEDVDDYIKSCRILEAASYHVVVGNPPYITVKDKQENENYRKAYSSCSGTYALSVPFAERIFKLAIGDGIRGGNHGYTGQITANSFMKREFGKKLIENYFGRQVTLTHVIDTSGAYIPGHGTPTVVLFGRRVTPLDRNTIRVVLGIRGEPSRPSEPEKGSVWQSLLAHVDDPGIETEWISVGDLERKDLAHFPWSLSGGGAAGLKSLLERQPGRLASAVASIGFMAVTREDDVYVINEKAGRRMGLEPQEVRPVSGGACLRDWSVSPEGDAIFPYSPDGGTARASRNLLRHLWVYRIHLGKRKSLSGTQEDRGLPWFTYSDFHGDRWCAACRIGFAFVATHNQLVSIKPGNLFIRTAPVIKLPEEAGEGDQFALLGVLNSSAACFWFKQVCFPKSGDPMGSEGARVSVNGWDRFYEFTATKLKGFPFPAELPLEYGRELDSLAQQLAAVEPSAVCAEVTPTRERLDAAQAEYGRIRGRMIAVQEELDWDVYRRYGLLSADMADKAGARETPGSVPEIDLGCRAFEIVMARRMARGELETQWFARHRSRPVTEPPAEWPEEYQQVVERRIQLIEGDRYIGLIERPDCKRRWATDPWEDKEQAALRTWLLDRCEERSLWYDGDEPRPMTVDRLADQFRDDTDVMTVAALLAGADKDLGAVLAEIVADEHVPFVAQYRYKPSGTDKRRQWERAWDLQREEDASGKSLNIPVPPKYQSVDFQQNSYWKHRGKLDVPKERFISYPRESRDSDAGSLLLGWAGWDHREQAAALINLIEDRATRDGWSTDRLMGLLAGLAEVMPWVRQWHDEIVPEHGDSYANAYTEYLTTQMEDRSITAEDLRDWTPPKQARGRRPAKRTGIDTHNPSSPRRSRQ